MTLLNHPSLKFLSHANWSGVGAICGFIALPIALTTIVLTWIEQPQKRLDIRTDSITFVLSSPADKKNPKPSNIYLISYNLINSGNQPILASDFADAPMITTASPNHILSILSASAITSLHPSVQKQAADWSSTNSTEWIGKPFLLNPNQSLPISVMITCSGDEIGSRDFDPTKCVHWSFAVAGLTEIRETILLTSRLTPAIISIGMPLPPCGIEIKFEGYSVWMFLALSIIFFIGVTLAWLRKRQDNYPNAYLLICHISLLLFFSFALAEMILCLFVNKDPFAWDYSAPIMLLYAAYLFVLFRPRKS